MKKNLILSLVVAGAMGLMLTGCGNKPEKVTVEVEPTTEVTTEVANPEEQPLIDVEPTVEAEVITEVIEVEVPEQEVDYLAENGITITPQGTMAMTVADYNSDSTHERNVTITVETVPSAEEGYSDTIFKAVWDTSWDTNFNTGYEAFDRYTGISLIPVDGDASFVDEGGTVTNAVVVEIDGQKYDCTETFDWDTSAGTTYVCTYTIHHPMEYNGVVFKTGKYTASMNAFQCPNGDVSCKLADHPELMEDQYFFTATDN